MFVCLYVSVKKGNRLNFINNSSFIVKNCLSRERKAVGMFWSYYFYVIFFHWPIRYHVSTFRGVSLYVCACELEFEILKTSQLFQKTERNIENLESSLYFFLY